MSSLRPEQQETGLTQGNPWGYGYVMHDVMTGTQRQALGLLRAEEVKITHAKASRSMARLLGMAVM